ncbi:MAG: hypothetical protein HEQ32_02465 [Vampirovibrio sp.]
MFFKKKNEEAPLATQSQKTMAPAFHYPKVKKNEDVDAQKSAVPYDDPVERFLQEDAQKNQPPLPPQMITGIEVPPVLKDPEPAQAISVNTPLPAPQEHQDTTTTAHALPMLAYEDDTDYFNPLAIGETLPTVPEPRPASREIPVLQSPIEPLEQDPFAFEADEIETLQAQFAMAQKANEALASIGTPPPEWLEAEEVEKVVSEQQASQKPANHSAFLEVLDNETMSPFQVDRIEAPPLESLHHTTTEIDTFAVDFETDWKEAMVEMADSPSPSAISPSEIVPLAKKMDFQPLEFDLDLFLQDTADQRKTDSSVLSEPDLDEIDFNFDLHLPDLDGADSATILEETPASLSIEASVPDLSSPFLSEDFPPHELSLEDTLILEDLDLTQRTALDLDEYPDTIDKKTHFLETEPLKEEASTLASSYSRESFSPLDSVHKASPEDDMIDPSIFFSLEDLENGHAPVETLDHLESIIDPPPAPLSSAQGDKKNTLYLPQEPSSSLDSSPLAPIPSAEADVYALLDSTKTTTSSNATPLLKLSNLTNLVLEEIPIIKEVPFPVGASQLFLVQLNELYALLIRKDNHYTLIQSFISLPEECTIESPHVHITWNATSVDEDIFLIQVGTWMQRIIETSKEIKIHTA